MSSRRRIAVCGPFKSQFVGVEQRLAKELGAAGVELIFVDKDKSPTPGAFSGCDCLVLSRFTSHKHQTTAQAVLGKERITFVEGGLGRLSQTILQLARA